MKRNGWYWFGRLVLWTEDRLDEWIAYVERIREELKSKKN